MSEPAAGLVNETLALCAIPSVTGDEARLADYLERRCKETGATTERRGQAVIARGPVVLGRPCIALFGHSDTVPPAAAQPLGIDGDRLYGCGASDMKGGLAVMLALLADATAPPTSTTPPLFANLLCIFYDREEGPLAESGLLPLCRDGSLAGIDLAICLEPTDSIIHAGCVGSLQAKVTIAGRRAHSARPWQGDSAIYAALPLLDALRRFARREVRIADLPFYEVLLATQANTNSSRNVVPDRFTLNLNYRYAPGKTVEAAGAELFEFVAQHSGLSPSAVDIEIVDAAPSGAVCIDQPRLRAWQAACGLPVAAKQAWTDVAQLTSLGIPAVNFGPGETAQAHQANESLPVAALLHAYRALGALLRLPGPPQ